MTFSHSEAIVSQAVQFITRDLPTMATLNQDLHVHIDGQKGMTVYRWDSEKKEIIMNPHSPLKMSVNQDDAIRTLAEAFHNGARYFWL